MGYCTVSPKGYSSIMFNRQVHLRLPRQRFWNLRQNTAYWVDGDCISVGVVDRSLRGTLKIPNSAISVQFSAKHTTNPGPKEIRESLVPNLISDHYHLSLHPASKFRVPMDLQKPRVHVPSCLPRGNWWFEVATSFQCVIGADEKLNNLIKFVTKSIDFFL
jgi:hypothetical protein